MKIKSATLKVTLRCNYNCKFCYQHQNYVDELKLNDIETIICTLKREGCTNLMISGGEPLLRTDIDKIISYAHKNGLYTKLATNGTLINKEKLITIRDAGLNELYISIGSLEENEKIERLIRIISEINGFDLKPLCLGINVITSKAFIQNAAKCFEWIYKLGLQNIYLIPPKHSLDKDWFEREKISINEHLKLYKEAMMWSDKLNIICDCAFYILGQLLDGNHENEVSETCTCPAAKSGINIASNGLVYPCSFLEIEEYCAGNFIEHDFCELMNSDGFQRFRLSESKSIFCPQCLMTEKV